MQDKIIVTGGLGYIGSHCVVELIQQGFDVVIGDNLSNSNISVLQGIHKITGVTPTFIALDFCDSLASAEFFLEHKDSIGVIHFAAFKAVGESVAFPLKYYHNNIGSLVQVIQNMNLHSIPNLIFSSSCTVYGQPDELPVKETSPIKKAWSPYGNTKQICEDIISDQIQSDSNSLHAISLRYFNPIGAHESALIGELPIGVPNNLMPFITQTAIGLRKELQVFGDDYPTVDGTAVRDYLHVVDVARAHVKSLSILIDSKGTYGYDVFNLGTGKGQSVLEVIQSFEKTSQQKLNYTIAPRREGDVANVYADTQKASEQLGWKTELVLDDMTRSAWQWELTLNKK